jgi:hypothetical protein
VTKPTLAQKRASGTAASNQATATIGQSESPTSHLYEGPLSRLTVVAVLEDAAVASSSLSPHIAVMQAADAGQCHHLRVR